MPQKQDNSKQKEKKSFRRMQLTRYKVTTAIPT